MTPPAAKRPLSYTNRKGRVYYLHAGKTKLGERRYFFAKTVGIRLVPVDGQYELRRMTYRGAGGWSGTPEFFDLL